MFEFLFDTPLLIAGPVIVVSLCLFGLVGLLVVRRCVLPKLRIHDSDSGFCSAMQQAVMVFYGLVVALILVNVWQRYSDLAKVISQEATAVAVLYRDVSSYTEPSRSQLQKQLREYVVQIIHQAWPLQQRGETPRADVKMMNTFQATLNSFEPLTEGQKVVHAETMRDYDRLVLAHGLRLEAVQVRLPNILWFIIITGAFISLSSSFFFRVEDVWLQGIQVSLLAAFIGMAIFLIFAFDRPFRGELGLRPRFVSAHLRSTNENVAASFIAVAGFIIWASVRGCSQAFKRAFSPTASTHQAAAERKKEKGRSDRK